MEELSKLLGGCRAGQEGKKMKTALASPGQ